jgi:hypothetical protein
MALLTYFYVQPGMFSQCHPPSLTVADYPEISATTKLKTCVTQATETVKKKREDGFRPSFQGNRGATKHYSEGLNSCRSSHRGLVAVRAVWSNPVKPTELLVNLLDRLSDMYRGSAVGSLGDGESCRSPTQETGVVLKRQIGNHTLFQGY